MQIILEIMPLIKKAIGFQTVDENIEYKRLTYCVELPVSEGMLLYNVLTKEMVLLSPDESRYLSNMENCRDSLQKELISHWFLLPVNMDEKKLCCQMRSMIKLLSSQSNQSSYTILTTTDCNARCFYCYEYGRKKVSMSEQTARDTAQYIIKSCKGKKVRLSWFGGEPLVNRKVIDLICDALAKAGIEYRSFITTNGYLFHRELAKKAREEWHVNGAQITLDGLETVYNTTKAYVNKDENAFARVVQNIEYLLQEKIRVSIRMNMDLHNADELFALCDFLSERFQGYDNLFVYVALLFENEGSKPTIFDDKTMEERYQKLFELQKYIEEKGLSRKSKISQNYRQHHCMADGDTSIVISPEGTFTKCQHFSGIEVLGDIYQGICDTEAVAKWKEQCPEILECDTCAVYPDCIRIKKCPDEKECNPSEQRLKLWRLQQTMIHTFESFKNETERGTERAE